MNHEPPAPSFIDCGISPELTKVVTALGYHTPTPIQQKSIPAILMGRDIIAISQTGSGKTASFALPAIDILANQASRARMPRCLILEPTRELASQVLDSINAYSKEFNLRSVLLIGGVAFDPQKKELMAGADIIIATPGRLLDHIERSRLILTDINLLVIDEADRMLDMGFIPDIIKILKLLPKSRQTLLFSATMANEIKNLTHQFMNNPKQIEVAPPASTAQTIDQRKLRLAERDKLPSLISLLQSENINNGLIFCNRKKDIGMVMKALKGRGIQAEELHGDLDQHQRLRTLQGFRDGVIKLLVCSDVAARGLDIPEVSHVFNLDVPTNAEDYVHRIGRTGRAGRAGKAILFVADDEVEYLAAVEKLIKQKILPLDGHTGEGGRGYAPHHSSGGSSREGARDAATGRSSYAPSSGGRRPYERGMDRNQGDDRDYPARGQQRDSRGDSRRDARGDSRGDSRGGPTRDSGRDLGRGSGRDLGRDSRGDSRRQAPSEQSRSQNYRTPNNRTMPEAEVDEALPSFLTTSVYKRQQRN